MPKEFSEIKDEVILGTLKREWQTLRCALILLKIKSIYYLYMMEKTHLNSIVVSMRSMIKRSASKYDWT